MKENIEKASVPEEDEYIAIDEISATAEVKSSVTGKTTFVFDPSFARIAFARGMNRHNPELKLPEPEPAGDCSSHKQLIGLFVTFGVNFTGPHILVVIIARRFP
ncbi:hypothetical protein ACN42_g4173 [Penicillium freii]|uniref:Uncharacterized protein n=1 Tax=Penicillium freii TaxID=48697 RepID=A0A101MLU8_PENFR|nr:hypothetical protein ACN42_g4173 [Penicillium freii]